MAHSNASDIYRGAYVRFHAADKRAGAALAGPDNAVGDVGRLEWDFDDDGNRRCWLINPYGAKAGYLEPGPSHPFALLDAKGWTIRYVLSFVAYSEDAPGCYWGEVAVIGFSPRYAERFERFLAAFAKAVGSGMRPDPNLNPDAVMGIVEDPESWKPGGKVRIPRESGRAAVLKDHRTLHDKFLDQARGKNPGCYVLSFVFMAAMVGLVVWLLRSLGLL